MFAEKKDCARCVAQDRLLHKFSWLRHSRLISEQNYQTRAARFESIKSICAAAEHNRPPEEAVAPAK